MDHLLLPEGAEPYIHATYNAKDSEHYDCQGFMGYPERMGWSEEDLLGQDNFGRRSNREVRIFFQTWLFFGLGIEVLASAGIDAKTEDFLDPGSPQVVTTKKVQSWLVEWKQLWPLPEGVSPKCTCKSWIDPNQNVCGEKPCWKDFPHARDSTEWAETSRILNRAQKFLDHYCTKRRTDQSSVTAWPVGAEISTSILALGWTLRRAAISIYDIPRMVNEWGTGSSSLLRDHLRGIWCRSDAAMMEDELQIDGLYYLAAAASPTQGYLESHTECTTDRCVAKVAEEGYVTRHAPACKKAACASSDPEDGDFLDSILNAIKNGGTPIIYWDGEQRRIVVEEFNLRKPIKPKYVSISHVWADGMGNPRSNMLPKCQLSRIQRMVDELHFPGRQPNERVGFWMDTLCVPVSKKHEDYRKSCIRNMRHIYSAASAVLILDSWLQEISSTAPLPERCVRIYQSRWQRRLWTFQEGALAQELYFRWSDETQHLRALMDERMKYTEEATARGIHIVFPALAEGKVTAHFTLVRSAVQRIIAGQDPEVNRWMMFLPLADALGHRRTTRLSDETLCMATILGIDPQPYLGVGGHPGDVVERRMQMFLREIGTFNAGLVFNAYQRLSTDGYRWAPRSLLGHRTSALGSIGDRQTARLRPVGPLLGLLVSYRGFVCEFGATATRVAEANETSFYIAVCNRTSKRPYYYSVKLRHGSVEWGREAAYGLVIARKPEEDEETLAMLGSLVPLPDDPVYADVRALRWECNAVVRCHRGEAPEGHVSLPMLGRATKWLVR